MNSKNSSANSATSIKKAKVLWVIPSLAGGGAERAIVTIVKHLDLTQIESHLCLFKRDGVFLPEVERAGVPIHVLDVNGRFDPKLLTRLPTLMRQLSPDITIGVLRGCAIMTTLLHKLTRQSGNVFINEQNTPSVEMKQFGNFQLKRLGYLPALKLADGVLAISKGIEADLQTHFGVPPAKISVIPNPVDTADLHTKAQAPLNHHWFGEQFSTIVSVGRLHPQKGHDLLLDAFAEVKTAVPNAKLIIVGKGPEKEQLLNQARRLHIEKDVELVGFQANPYPFIQHANLFVLASRYEGFGIVLAEALVLETAVIAANCPSGPADILAQGKAGKLVQPNDAKALATGIIRLLNDSKQQSKYRAVGRTHVAQFSETAVAKQYASFIKMQNSKRLRE